MSSPDRVDRRPRLIGVPDHSKDPRLNLPKPVTDPILRRIQERVAREQALKRRG